MSDLSYYENPLGYSRYSNVDSDTLLRERKERERLAALGVHPTGVARAETFENRVTPYEEYRGYRPSIPERFMDNFRANTNLYQNLLSRGMLTNKLTTPERIKNAQAMREARANQYPAQTGIEHAAAWLGGTTNQVADPIGLGIGKFTGAATRGVEAAREAAGGAAYEGTNYALGKSNREERIEPARLIGKSTVGAMSAPGGSSIANVAGLSGVRAVPEVLSRGVAGSASQGMQDAGEPLITAAAGPDKRYASVTDYSRPKGPRTAYEYR